MRILRAMQSIQADHVTIAGDAMRIFVVEDSAAVRERLVEMTDGLDSAEAVGQAATFANAVAGIRDAAVRQGQRGCRRRILSGQDAGFREHTGDPAAHERHPGGALARTLSNREQTVEDDMMQGAALSQTIPITQSKRHTLTVVPVEASAKSAIACSSCCLREACLPCRLGDADISRFDEITTSKRKIAKGHTLHRLG